MKQSIKTGTRIEMHGTPAMGVAPEAAKIARWTAVNGWLKNHVSPTNGGWHIVKFADGGKLCVHETRFRVTDNRAEG